MHDLDGEHHLIHPIAFVVVESSLHAHDTLAFQRTHHQPALVPKDSGDREIGNVLIGNCNCVLQFISEATETAAQDHADIHRSIADSGRDIHCSFLHLIHEFIH